MISQTSNCMCVLYTDGRPKSEDIDQNLYKAMFWKKLIFTNAYGKALYMVTLIYSEAMMKFNHRKPI